MPVSKKPVRGDPQEALDGSAFCQTRTFQVFANEQTFIWSCDVGLTGVCSFDFIDNATRRSAYRFLSTDQSSSGEFAAHLPPGNYYVESQCGGPWNLAMYEQRY